MNKIVYAGRTFTDDQITAGQCYLSQSLLSSSLEIDTFDFSVSSDDPTLVDYQQDAPLQYYRDDVFIGTYFVQQVNRVSRKIYDFSCVSVVGLLDKADHYGGIYAGQTVEEVVTDICKGFTVTFAANVKRIKLYGWLPVASARENLAQVLFATSSTITVGADASILVKGLDDTVKSQIGEDRLSLDSSVQYDPFVTKVVVLEHQYVKSTEEKKLFEGTTSAGDRIIFSEPMHTLKSTGFSVTEAGDNYAIVSAGSGTLTGQTYTHTTREMVGTPPTRAATNIENIIRVEDATLISLANSRAVADRLAEYYTHTQHIVTNMDYQTEQAGQVVNIQHPYNAEKTLACVESMDITLSKRLSAQTSALVGYLPPDISQIEYYDTFEILTGSGTWTAPKGVKNLRAVLIGGGTGGQSATAGEDGGIPPRKPLNTITAKGGAGGIGGKGGKGGNIFQAEITAKAGDSFSYQSGAAGVSGAYDATTQNLGRAGTASVFGSLSSASGTPSDIGYTNPFSGETYAKRGEDGVNGAAGGASVYPSNRNTYSENGQDVLTWTGGRGGLCYLNPSDATGWTQYHSAGGGGGAAYGSNGEDGQNADQDYTGPDGQKQRMKGGNGGNATLRGTVVKYGQGGEGGNGGGGGGANGKAYFPAEQGDPEDYILSLGTPEGGAGTAGGAAGAGCIILFYSLPQPVTGG